MAEDELLETETVLRRSEDEIINDGFEKLKLNGNTIDIPEWLQNTESPFNWMQVRIPDVESKEVIKKVTERIEKDEGLNDSFPYEKFVCLLTLVFELNCQGEERLAWENLLLCEKLLKKENFEDEKTYGNQSDALNHVLQSSKAHLLFRTGREEEAKQVVARLQSMPVHSLAAVQGLKAWFFHHYREKGAQLALQYARKALSLEPNSPLWMLLTSQSIRRLRKFSPEMDEISREEVELMERVVDMKRSLRHLLLLAQVYREAGENRFKKHRNEQDIFHSQTFYEISDIQAKAFELYREALSLKPHSEVVNRLCGYGLLKLPAFKSDYRLAERCLQRALERNPNNATTIHALGLYYYKGLMDYERAALFCEKAGKLGNFPASLDMLRMKRLVYGSNYDPVFDFEKLLHQYGDDQIKKHEILCQMGSYYLFFERNVIKSLKYFKTLIKENAELSIITSHKSTFLNMACKINLLQYIANSGQQLLEENKLNLDVEENSTGIEDVKIFLNELQVTNPELFQAPVNKNLIDDLHKVSDDIKQTYVRKKERRESIKERRRSSLTDRRSSLTDKRSSITDRRSSLTDQRNSLDNDKTKVVSRRQSEGSLNFRRRSSGNIEAIQHRTFKNFNNPKQQTSKSTDGKDISRRINDDLQKRNGKLLDFCKDKIHNSNEEHMNKSTTNSVTEATVQNRSFRKLKQKKECFEILQISEI